MGTLYSLIFSAPMDHQKDTKKGKEEEQPKLHFRLTITNRNVKAIEDVTKEIIQRAKGRKEANSELTIRGPRRMPTKTLRITTRKSPCGNGTNTFDKYEMRIHKRVIDFICTREDLKKITNIEIAAGIIIEANELD